MTSIMVHLHVYNVQPAGEPPLFIHEDREIMEPTSQGLNPSLL